MSLEVVHCFGFDPETGLEYADTSVLVALCGNGFHFSSVERDSRSRFLWGAGTSISCYAINRRARLLAYAEKGLSPRIFIHDLLTHELLCTLNGAAKLSVCALAFSRDGKKLGVSSRVPDQQLTIWDWPKREVLSTLELSFDAELLSFSPLTSDVICAMGSGKLQLVGVVKTPHETNYIRRDAPAPLPVVPLSHCWTTNGNLLLGCEDGSLVYFDVEQLSPVPCPGNVSLSWLSLDVPIRAVEPTVDMLAIACGDGFVRFLTHPELESGQPSRLLLELRLTPDEEPAELLSIRWSTDFSEMIAVASDANVYRMQVSTSGTAQTFAVEVTATLWASCHTGAVTGTGALPGGTRFASTGEDGSLRIWDIERTELLERLLMGSQQTSLATHKHTGFIATGSEYGVLRIFFAEDEAEPPQLVFRKRLHREPIRIVEFSPSGAQLLSIADDGRICFLSMSPSPRVIGYLDVSTLRNPEFNAGSLRTPTGRDLSRSSTLSARPGSREGRDGRRSVGPRQSAFTRTLSRALSVLKPKRVEDTQVEVGAVVWAPTAEFYNSGAEGAQQQQQGVDFKIDGEIILSVCEVGGPPSLMIVNSVPPDLPSQPDMYINSTDVEVLVIPVDIPLVAMTAVHDAPSPNLTGGPTRKSQGGGRSSTQQRGSTASLMSAAGGGGRNSVPSGSPATGSRPSAAVSVSQGGVRTSASLALLFSETMTLLSLGADKTLRKYTLTNKWYRDRLSSGQPLPMLEADSAMDVTDKVGGNLRISPSGKSLLLALEDGTLQLRTFDGKAVSIAPHDTLRGGANCMSIELSGGYAVSSGLDGMSFLLYSKEFEAPAAAPMPPALPFDMNTVEEQYDEEDEKTVLEATIEPPEVADEMDMTIRNNTLKDLERLRERHSLLLARNAAAPDMEKLPPHDLVVDNRLRDLLAAEADAAASLFKSRAFTDNLKRDVISSRIRGECWDSMAARGVMVTGATCTPEVSGFAIRALPEDEARTLRRVVFLRKVEMAEEACRGKGGIAAALEKEAPDAGPRASAASTAAGDAPEPAGSFAGAPSSLSRSLSRLSMGGQSDAGGAGGKASPFERLLYSPLDLSGLVRKRQQMSLLAAVIRERQAQFNEQVEKVKGAKDNFVSRVRDINSRIKDICRDIDVDLAAPGAEPLFEPQTAPGETDVDALTVKPEEIHAEKWLTPEERKLAEERQRQEEARRREAEGDTPAARALKQMMGGVLRSAQDKREGAPEKPTFMDRVPKEQWTEEQQRAVKDYEAREKLYHEEREKKVKLLEAELKKLRAEIAEAMAAFNASVAALAEERWAANGAVAELELQVCRLALDVETTSRKGEAEENALCDALAAARRDHKEAVKALSYFRRVLDATSEAFEALSNEDKAHEKNFRREFAEVGMEYYEELSRLYKRRGPRPADDAQGDKPPQKLGSRRMSMGMGKDPAMQQVKQRMKRASQYGRMSAIPAQQQDVAARFAEMESIPAEPRDAFAFVDAPKVAPPPVVSVHPVLDQPEGLDQWIWNHFLEARTEKIASEERLAKQRTVLEDHQKHLARLEEAERRLQQRAEQLEAELAESRRGRARSVYDLELTLRLKQGQVELPTSSLGMGIDTSDAVLVHRSFVESLNAEVRRQGKARVDGLTQIKDFKREIYALQWENKRADMEIEDLLENNRALQLLKLPKNYQQMLELKPETAAADEVSALERRLAFSRKDHARRLDEYNRRIQRRARVQQQTMQIRSGTDALRHDLAALEREVLDQRRIQERAGGDQKAAEEAAVARRRMRAVVTRRQLVDIAKGQAADLAALREEIHNIRLRTYPSFVDTKAGQPVRKPLPDQREESLRSAPPPSSRERSALRSPAVAPGLGLPMSEGTTIPGGGNWSSQGPRRSTASRGKG